MPRILHLIVSEREPDLLADSVICDQKSGEKNDVVVLDLNAAEPVYGKAVEEIFKADSIETW